MITLNLGFGVNSLLLTRLTIRTRDMDSAGERPILLAAKLYATCATTISDAGAPVHCEDGPPGAALRGQASKHCGP